MDTGSNPLGAIGAGRDPTIEELAKFWGQGNVERRGRYKGYQARAIVQLRAFELDLRRQDKSQYAAELADGIRELTEVMLDVLVAMDGHEMELRIRAIAAAKAATTLPPTTPSHTAGQEQQPRKWWQPWS